MDVVLCLAFIDSHIIINHLIHQILILCKILKNGFHFGNRLLLDEFSDASIGIRFQSSSFITNDHGIKWSISYFFFFTGCPVKTSLISWTSMISCQRSLTFLSFRPFSSVGVNLYTRPRTSGLLFCSHFTFSYWIHPKILTVWSLPANKIYSNRMDFSSF